MNGVEAWPQVHRIPDEAMGNTSYLVRVDAGSAISIDPRRDAEEHIKRAERESLSLIGVLETHLHADFVSGAREIADATGAHIYAAGDARLEFPHHPVNTKERLAFGRVNVEVIPAPGHTPEHVAYLVSHAGRHGLFSGGSLIVGGVARTDLSGSERTAELSRAQFATLRRLGGLPDDTALYPTHGAGSFCSTARARSTSSTIGAERRSNPLFAIEDQDEFVARLRAGFGTYPRYFAHLHDVNRAGPALLRTLDPVSEIAAEAAKDAADAGAWLIDGRAVEDWAHAHPAGAVSVEVRAAFASWLGWVVPFGAPLVLVLEPGQVPEAIRLARLIGYDRIEGWTTFDAWRAAGLPVSSIEPVSPTQAVERAGRGAVLLDVRQHAEWTAGRIAGAAHLELGDVIAGKTPEATEVIAYCGHGERSATAASLLERRGLRVANLRGGLSAWRRAALPLEP